MCLEPYGGWDCYQAGVLVSCMYTLVLQCSATLTMDESKIKFCQTHIRSGEDQREIFKLYNRHRHVVINLLNKTSYKWGGGGQGYSSQTYDTCILVLNNIVQVRYTLLCVRHISHVTHRSLDVVMPLNFIHWSESMYQLVSGIMDDRYIVTLSMDGFSSSKYFQFNFGVSLTSCHEVITQVIQNESQANYGSNLVGQVLKYYHS